MTKPAHFSDVIRIGRDAIESEEVATVKYKERGRKYTVTLVFNRVALPYAISSSGLTALPLDDEHEARRIVDKALATFRAGFPEWARGWLTRILVVEDDVKHLTVAQFLRWLESRPDDLHRWLGVPAIQAHIQRIRDRGTPTQRRALGRIVGNTSDGRPKRLPDDRIVYQWVIQGERALAPVDALIKTSKNANTAWRHLQAAHSETANVLKALRLDESWFKAIKRPRSQVRTIRYMACELVAAREGFSVGTIQKAAGRVDARRSRRTVPQIFGSHTKKPI